MQPNETPRHGGHHIIFPSLHFTITSEYRDGCLQPLIILMEDFLLQRSTKVTNPKVNEKLLPVETAS